MKKNIFLVLLACTAIVGGCAASVGLAPGYSRLDTIPPADGPIPVVQGVRPVVAVGPIGVPGYIVRAKTIMDFTPNAANISMADQSDAFLYWEIPRVISIDIERLLAPKGIAVVSSGIGAARDYRIAVDVSALDLTKFNTIETKAQWALYRGANAAPVLVKDISFSTPVAGNNSGAVLAAMSRSLADLTTAIVRDFEEFLGTR
ncbi:MAG: hypothetical protein H6Q52_496 [Deltaproteobacteria bacterium]|nr:hypothetical protein [Deltaproteobacteria bacterium]